MVRERDTPETSGQNAFRLIDLGISVIGGLNPADFGRLNLPDLTTLLKLAYETGYILSTFPTSVSPETNSTMVIIPSDPNQKPTIKHGICVAYKYHPYGGLNSIEIQEGEEMEGEGETQINLSFKGHTTGHKEVTVATTRLNLREGLKKLISIGREAGAASDFRNHGINHPTEVFFPEFLPQSQK